MLFLKKLNLCCGLNKLEGFLNVDFAPEANPDFYWDLRHSIPVELPYGYFEEIYFMHGLEHIEYQYHSKLFTNLHKLLRLDGTLTIGYPEWETCVKYFLENKQGQKEFWRVTLFGGQQYAGDYHVSACQTPVVVNELTEQGFLVSHVVSEPPPQEYNTIVRAVKLKAVTYEDLVANEVCKVQPDVQDKSISWIY